MESIKEVFRIGAGPSSSHTMGPKLAAELFRARVPEAAAFRVTLYESLAATGKGHLTDKAIQQALTPFPVEIVWAANQTIQEHPNAMYFEALDDTAQVMKSWMVFSVGGGALREAGQKESSISCYPQKTLEEIMDICSEKGWSYWEYVEHYEEGDIWNFLATIWHIMQETLERGLQTTGVLPGELRLARKARDYYQKALLGGIALRQTGLLVAYALAIAEENASGATIVTAPTCGASGVLPAVLYHLQIEQQLPLKAIYQALATAGLIGTIIKTNASISGAEVGCQGEIGSACSMAAAAATQLMGGTIRQIEYAAEMGLEHHLGLTCDPVGGLVQIPCIERNAMAATRAMNIAQVAILSDGTHRIPFDEVVRVMKETGHDLPSLYRETSHGGLAKAYGQRRKK